MLHFCDKRLVVRFINIEEHFLERGTVVVSSVVDSRMVVMGRGTAMNDISTKKLQLILGS